MKHYYIDIETYKKRRDSKYEEVLDTNEFILGAIMEDTGECYVYENKKEMQNALLNLLRSGRNIAILGHNLEYDFYGIFKDKIKELITNEELNIIRSSPMLGIFNQKNYFLDTMAFFPNRTLEDIGELIGFPKLGRKEIIDEPNELRDYLIRDVEILKVAMERLKGLLKELNYNPRKMITIGDVSMKLLSKYIRDSGNMGWYMRGGSFITNEDNVEFLRKASKGGRVQMFMKGKFENANQIDLNSAYWEAMKKMPFPDLLKEKRYDKELIDIIGYKRILSYTGVVKCEVKTSGKGIGVLPVRTNLFSQRNYKLEFPNDGDTLKGYWTTFEVKEAIKRGYELIEIEEAVVYLKDMKESILTKYVDDLWALRKKYKNDMFCNKLIKIMGNSLYGKFLQRSKKKQFKWIERRQVDHYIEEGWTVISESSDYCICKETEGYVPRHLNVILGVLITSYARVLLLEVLEKLERPVYCDTDGIIFLDKINRDEMNIGDELGQFKIEHENEDCCVVREKGYYIGDDIKLSRIQRRFRTKELLEAGEDAEIEQPEMIKLNDVIDKGNFEDLGTFILKKHKIVKSQPKNI